MKWFTEYWTDHVKFSIRIKKLVYSKETEYQKLEIYDSYEFGRFMTLDGYMMVNEKDEFIYHDDCSCADECKTKCQECFGNRRR